MSSFTECHRCGQPGHYARQCTAPLSPPVPPPGEARADSYTAHLGRIDAIVQLWVDGTITRQQKRQAIADENFSFYGGPKTRSGISLTRA